MAISAFLLATSADWYSSTIHNHVIAHEIAVANIKLTIPYCADLAVLEVEASRCDLAWLP